MSIIDPQKRTDYVIKEKQVRELLVEAEIGKGFLEELNMKVVHMLIQADNRRKKNKRRRIFPCDL